ncbi:glycoside hydrolase family 16 protein [Persicobacter diffluens]|uniref:GH16 domain-containing protein n=1 Tax=Persicobacter diffluens TaxID=981 RepID=A0AAN4W2C6_9BACT|nr:hypothetical protein PEDI_49530 [Persicobacter diffluens]
MRSLVFLFFGLALLACEQKEHASYLMTWSDEFNYQGLPDSTKWNYEEGFVRNNELQYYTVKDLNNVAVRDGHLAIQLRKDSAGNITSGSLHTLGKFEFTYGKVEIRAKIPHGLGTWPALWTLGTNIKEVGWPKCGEIDIMEFVGYMPDTIHGTVHTQNYNHTTKTDRGGHFYMHAPWEDFHVYSMEWSPEEIRIFVDNQQYFSISDDGSGEDSWPFKNQAHYLLLNLAFGGSWGAQQGLDYSIFPQEMLIDYVRYYQLQSL